MTENKRFQFASTSNGDWVVLDEGNILWKDEILHLLNELHEEDEQLKKENKQLKKQLDKFEFSQTTNFIEYNKDKLYVNDTHTTIDLKDGKLCIEVEIPSNDDVFRFFYWVTGKLVLNEVEVSNRFEEGS